VHRPGRAGWRHRPRNRDATANITSCTFGGADYRTLDATSASLGGPPADRLAGGLFAIEAEVAGQPENRFRIAG
jgi:sugar lactone lactonase YvrE